MTTQSGSSSPFQSTTDEKELSAPIPFTFRTMQDDLLTAQGSGLAQAPKAETKIETKKTPIESFTQNTAKNNPISASPTPFDDKKDVTPLTAATVPNKNINEAASTQKIAPVEIQNTEKETPSNNNSLHKIIISIVIFLSIGIISLGVYYMLLARTNTQDPIIADPIVEIPTPIIEPVEEEKIPVEKYTTDKPNYLVLDLSKLSAIEIKQTINGVAEELKTFNSKSLYEFIVVDTNNNPISFPIFATAAELNLSPTALNNLGENFSLYAYIDNGNMRLGLSATIANIEAFSKEIKKQEKTLPADLSFMFLEKTPATIQGWTFKDGVYNNIQTRYLNLDEQGTISIDYAITNNILILGTSMNTERAILDKVAQQKTTTTDANDTAGDPSVN